MKNISNFSLESHQVPYESWPLKTRLFFNGEDTGKFVSGFVIEQQYSLNNGYFLLIVSYNCPFEESNDFYLLNSEYNIKSKKSLLYPYESYFLTDTEILNENEILLEYCESLKMKLTICPDAGWFQSKLKLQRCENLL